jgi:hypothetical protein
MKFSRSSLALLLAPLTALVVPLAAEPTVGPPVQAHGGQNGARGRALDDLELTAITKAEESFWPQANALAKARAELLRSSLQLAPNSPALAAKAQALADAELAYSQSRADAFAKLKVQLKASTPAKVETLLRAMSDPAGSSSGTIPGGGRGAQAQPAALPPAGRGN